MIVDLSNLTVEVRDKDLNRLGIIAPQDLNLTLQDLYIAPGDWDLELDAQHKLASALLEPGAGIIVSMPNGELFSGPVETAEYAERVTAPEGIVKVAGRTDGVHLTERLALPDPSSPVASQTVARDVRTGPVETIMHGFVNANLGPGATADRRVPGLIMGTDLGRGPTVTRKARFHDLDYLLAKLAIRSSLGHRIVQRGNDLVFECYAVTDRTSEIRLAVEPGTLGAFRLAHTAPGVTHVIVGGQGVGVNRTIIERSNATSEAAGTAWGRRKERWIDQRQSDEVADYEEAADELLLEEGFTGEAMQIVPTTDSGLEFGEDFYLGDKISVIAGDSELQVAITGYRLILDDAGVRLGLLVGDELLFQQAPRPDQARPKTISSSGGGSYGSIDMSEYDNRLRDLETSFEVPDGWTGGIGSAGLHVGPLANPPQNGEKFWFITDDFSV